VFGYPGSSPAAMVPRGPWYPDVSCPSPGADSVKRIKAGTCAGTKLRTLLTLKARALRSPG